MRAQLLRAPRPVEEGPLELVDPPVPEPGPGQVRIRVTACGACRTDLHTVEGELELPGLPLVPGHQVVGVVDALGEDATGFAVGDRAGAIWLGRTCGTCSHCASGRENLCEAAEFNGLHLDGGYAEYMVAYADFAHRLPAGPSDAETAPLLCGGVVGYRALRLSEAKPGGVLGLYGFGNSAHVTIQVARHLGCRVFAFTRSKAHREHAARLGAEWAGAAGDEPPEKLDAGIIFAPAGELVPAALGALKPGGTLALAGIHMSPIPEMPYALLYRERTVRSVANSTRQDARELLELAAEIPVRTDVTAFPLEEANAVLLAVKESRISGNAVLTP
ncbi:MAG: zinc-dependent alcohol dehydrogenase family protein, partial [Planctomycetota bacterium]|jgi:propanol-preferring alcohol dehydrogenase